MPGPSYAGMKTKADQVTGVKAMGVRAETEAARSGSESDSENEFPKHTGGGWYELSNGDKIQGQDDAIKAEKKLG